MTAIQTLHHVVSCLSFAINLNVLCMGLSCEVRLLSCGCAYVRVYSDGSVSPKERVAQEGAATSLLAPTRLLLVVLSRDTPSRHAAQAKVSFTVLIVLVFQPCLPRKGALEELSRSCKLLTPCCAACIIAQSIKSSCAV